MFIYDIVVIGKNISAVVAAMYSGMAQRSLLHILCPEEEHGATGVNKMIGYKEGGYDMFYKNCLQQLSGFNVESLEESVHKINIGESSIIIKTKTREVEAKTVIISTKNQLNIVNGDTKKDFVFFCGEALNGDQELASLAGTGCMASIDSQSYLNEKC